MSCPRVKTLSPFETSKNSISCWTSGYKLTELGKERILLVDCDHKKKIGKLHIKNIIKYLTEVLGSKINYEIYETSKGYHLISVLPNQLYKREVNWTILYKYCFNLPFLADSSIQWFKEPKQLDRIRTGIKTCHYCGKLLSKEPEQIMVNSNYLDFYNKKDKKYWLPGNYATLESIKNH